MPSVIVSTDITFINSTTLAACKNPVSQDLRWTYQTQQNIHRHSDSQ